MTDESYKTPLEPVEVYGENPSVFASFMRDETNIAIWQRGISTNLRKYLDEIEHGSNCEGISDYFFDQKVSYRTISFKNGQTVDFSFDKILDRLGIDYLMDDVRAVLTALIESISVPVRFDSRAHPAIRFHSEREARQQGYYGPIVGDRPMAEAGDMPKGTGVAAQNITSKKNQRDFHQDWVPRGDPNQGKNFTCIVNYIGPTTEFILGFAYNSVFRAYEELTQGHGQGRRHLQAAANSVFPNERSEGRSFFASAGLYNVALFADNNIADGVGPIYYAPVACMHRVPTPGGTRLILVVHGYTLPF